VKARKTGNRSQNFRSYACCGRKCLLFNCLCRAQLKRRPNNRLRWSNAAEAAPAWERRRQTGFGKALFTTWKEVLFYPGTTFGQLKSSGGFAAPLLFQAIMTTLLMAVLAIFRTVGVTIGWPAEPTLLYYAGPILVGVPLSIGLNFVLAGVFHFCLMLMKGKSKAYEATYRVTSYCSSAYVFGVIPFFGLYVSWIWGLICMAVGLQKVHKTEG
jgi:hypothetical protein